jgi:hypothetical protein
MIVSGEGDIWDTVLTFMFASRLVMIFGPAERGVIAPDILA